VHSQVPIMSDERQAKKELQKRGKLVIAKKFGGVPSLEVSEEQVSTLKTADQDAVRALQEHDRKKLKKKGGDAGSAKQRPSLSADTSKVTRSAEGEDMDTPRGLRAAMEKKKGDRRRASVKKSKPSGDDESKDGETKDDAAVETKTSEETKQSGASTPGRQDRTVTAQQKVPALECCWRSYISCVGKFLGCCQAGLRDPMVIERLRERLSHRKAGLLADIDGEVEKASDSSSATEGKTSETTDASATPRSRATLAAMAKREAIQKRDAARRQHILENIDWEAMLPLKYRKVANGKNADKRKASSPKRHKFKAKKAITAIEVKSVNTFAGDPYVSHPMVRIYLVDCRTGELLKKESPSKAAVSSGHESSTGVTWKFANGEFVPQRSGSDCAYVLPITTMPTKLQTSGKGPVGKGADWNEELLLNFHPSLLLRPHLLILVEVVDYGSKIPLQQLRRGQGLYSIAWGFLYPTGFDGTPNLGASLRVKLWKYQEPTRMQLAQAEGMGIRTGYGRIPDIYLQFLSSRRVPFGGFLHLAIFPRMKPEVTEGATRPSSVFHAETSTYQIPTLADIKIMQREQLEKGKEISDFEARANEQDGAEFALKRLRKEGEACVVPNKFFKKVAGDQWKTTGSGSNGCVSIKISPSGNFIAAAFARNDPRLSDIMIYSTAQNVKLVRRFCGHADLVHHLTWVYPSTPMPEVLDRDLCSASADGTVRLWRMDNPVETELAENPDKKKKRKKKKRKKKNPLQIGSKDGVPMFKAAVILRHPIQVCCCCDGPSLSKCAGWSFSHDYVLGSSCRYMSFALNVIRSTRMWWECRVPLMVRCASGTSPTTVERKTVLR